MGYDLAIKQRVIRLRSRGMTYSEIVANIDIKIPKSTLSEWCRAVNLPKWYKTKIDKLNQKNFKKAQGLAHESLRIKRKKLLADLLEKNKDIGVFLENKEILKLLLAILHLGEGAKWKSHRGLMLGSSDPNIINLYIKLLEICYGIKAKELKCRVSYRADQDIDSLEKYWSRATTIPLVNFYKTKPDPRTVGKKTKNSFYMGVCVVMHSGTHIQLELEMIPNLILEKIMIE